jgi:hypothetical protein
VSLLTYNITTKVRNSFKVLMPTFVTFLFIPHPVFCLLSLSFYFKLVQLVGQDGCKDLDSKEQFNREPALKVVETWQKLHNGKWVIGISVCNNGRR